MDSPNNGGTEQRKAMRDAAFFLLKGGSLLGTPCEACSGVQIKYKGEITCINCGNHQSIKENSVKAAPEPHLSKETVPRSSRESTSFQSVAFEIEERIIELFKILKSELPIDPDKEKQRIELIDMYLGLLKKFKKYDEEMGRS